MCEQRRILRVLRAGLPRSTLARTHSREEAAAAVTLGSAADRMSTDAKTVDNVRRDTANPPRSVSLDRSREVVLARVYFDQSIY